MVPWYCAREGRRGGVTIEFYHARTKNILSHSHINRCTVISNRNSLFLSQLFISEPPNKCTDHLQSYELGSKTNTDCFPFHFLSFVRSVYLYILTVCLFFWNRLQHLDCFICQLKAKRIKVFYSESGLLGKQACKQLHI